VRLNGDLVPVLIGFDYYGVAARSTLMISLDDGMCFGKEIQ
jgi:hypothetical protein